MYTTDVTVRVVRQNLPSIIERKLELTFGFACGGTSGFVLVNGHRPLRLVFPSQSHGWSAFATRVVSQNLVVLTDVQRKKRNAFLDFLHVRFVRWDRLFRFGAIG